MALMQVKTPFNIDLQFDTAPFHKRLFAWMVDFFILYLFLRFMLWLLDSSFSMENASEFGFTEIFLIAPLLLYHLICEFLLNGQSLGKLLLKVHVVSLTGKIPTASQLLLRWLSRFIDFGLLWAIIFLASGQIFLGILLCIASLTSFVLFVSTPQSQRIGDMIAGTTVVNKKLPYNLSDTIFKDLDMRTYQPVFPSVMRLSDKDINIINNIVKHNNQSSIANYLNSVAEKIQGVLNIQTDMPSELFLETLLRDYNYLSRK